MAAEMRLKVQKGFKAGTRIKTIEVPDQLRVKHQTGLDWLDTALGGQGFTPTSTMMLTGGPGCGKSTMLRQLADSMTQRGHIVVYNTGEESLYQAKLACERLKLEENFMVAEETKLPPLLEFLDNVKKQNPTRQVALLQDSLQTLDDGKYRDGGTTGNTPVRCTENIVEWMQENFGFCVFIGQCTKSGDFAGKNVIRHAIDIHGSLYYDEDKKSDTYGCLLFEVTKNRWGVTGHTFIMGLTGQGLEERGSFRKEKGHVVEDSGPT